MPGRRAFLPDFKDVPCCIFTTLSFCMGWFVSTFHALPCLRKTKHCLSFFNEKRLKFAGSVWVAKLCSGYVSDGLGAKPIASGTGFNKNSNKFRLFSQNCGLGQQAAYGWQLWRFNGIVRHGNVVVRYKKPSSAGCFALQYAFFCRADRLLWNYSGFMPPWPHLLSHPPPFCPVRLKPLSPLLCSAIRKLGWVRGWWRAFSTGRAVLYRMVWADCCPIRKGRLKKYLSF